VAVVVAIRTAGVAVAAAVVAVGVGITATSDTGADAVSVVGALDEFAKDDEQGEGARGDTDRGDGVASLTVTEEPDEDETEGAETGADETLVLSVGAGADSEVGSETVTVAEAEAETKSRSLCTFDPSAEAEDDDGAEAKSVEARALVEEDSGAVDARGETVDWVSAEMGVGWLAEGVDTELDESQADDEEDEDKTTVAFGTDCAAAEKTATDEAVSVLGGVGARRGTVADEVVGTVAETPVEGRVPVVHVDVDDEEETGEADDEAERAAAA
jgi:hypothetical protein